MTTFSISKVEKQVLFKKYIKMNYTYDEADNKIHSFCQFLKDFKVKLQKMKMPEEDINKRFKKEFEKLVQKLEVGEEYITKIGKNTKRRIFR
jgi:DNA/RNA-binding domain of Phe-tRNA-synthetase-like protein